MPVYELCQTSFFCDRCDESLSITSNGFKHNRASATKSGWDLAPDGSFALCPTCAKRAETQEK